ncbi:MAG: M23 family metallopeptidase [Desulfuromonadales bacterium]|nr:M23 family metallopeptidase [Desulfuromonadales bacterium]
MAKFSSIVVLLVAKTGLKNRAPIYLMLGFFCLFLSACETGIYHTVKRGQTLYRIGHTYNVDEKYLARVNGIHDPSQIKIGTRIFIPGAKRSIYVPVVAPSVTKKTVTAAVKKKPAVIVKPKPKVYPAKPAAAKIQPVKPKATQIKKLQWPLRGKIVRPFSKIVKAGGGRGIEIAVKAGSSVVAAEAGKVIYSGDGVDGYDFLVILQHENDFFTVYGFNRKNLVKQGDYVSKGERIALSGIPPSGGQARLHFEVRKGKVAVNPVLYLP